ncbi:MAG: adenylate kinase [Propionibacteriaceae bacterium]|nr:adenylate kinase [Propionibacteriaceae bacterium]
MRLLIIGAPGSGKGTQADAIAQHYGVPAISTGNMFRAAVASGSPLGEQVKAIMESGALVPDEVTDAVVADRLGQPDAAGGWLLDGYPRNLAQVATLDAYLGAQGQALDAVVLLDVPADLLIDRLLKRAQIEGRADDTEATIRHRMDVYQDSTAPLIQAFQARDLLVRVGGVGEVDEVRERIAAALTARLGR